MSGDSVHVRYAAASDAEAIADLASQLATSFRFSRTRFHNSYAALLAGDDACLLVATLGDSVVGYLLGYQHGTFYANGPVAWVEEILVLEQARRRGIGRTLMQAFESWAKQQDCLLVALATRRAAPFYAALGFEESATYLRKVLPA